MIYKFHKHMVVGLSVLALVVTGVASASGVTAENNDISWGWDNPPVFAIDSVQKPASPPQKCTLGKYFLGGDVIRSDVCVTDRGTWRFGKYTYYPTGSSYSETGYAISFGNDSKMYRVHGIDSPLSMHGTDAMVYTTRMAFFDTRLNVVQNFPSKLQRTTNYINGAIEYEFRQPADFVLKRPNGEGLNVVGVGISSNGRWLAAELPEVGIVRIDLQTLEVRRVSQKTVQYWRGSNPSVEFAISNDGRHIVAMGHNFFSIVIEVTENCGDILTDESDSTASMVQPCEEFDLSTYLQGKLDNFRFGYYPSFDEDGVRLNFLAGLNDWSATWVTITAGGFNPPARLDYLALGDSYSSGEGDTEVNQVTKQKYYLPNTDIEGTDTSPEEKCHISTRSYPFVLKDAMKIPAYSMKSIACSGAVGAKDYAQSNDGYDGQNGRLGVLGNPQTIDQYKAAALNEHIPGRNQQIEFVRKYRPKAITLTAGGNDVGFAEIAAACAIPMPRGCDYARTDRGKAKLGSAIAQQYAAMTELYRKLQEVSPETKIYVLGYPQFLSDDKLFCQVNVRFNPPERTMARAAVAYLNDTIEAAANSAGVKYIDIENSLGENILCGDGEPYVTGIAMSGEWNQGVKKMFSQESYHPNAKGHKAIAGTVQEVLGGKTLTEYNCQDGAVNKCPNASMAAPAPNSYFADAMSGDPTNYSLKEMVKKIMQKGKDIFSISLSNLEPNTAVDVTIFSDPLNLGTYTTDGLGRIDVEIAIPHDLSAGFHTVEVATNTFSGEPITYWQIVEVHGSAGDVDENSLPDSEQQCLFISEAGMDYDGDGTDDACDLEIGPAPVLVTQPSSTDSNQHSGEVPIGDESAVNNISLANVSHSKENAGIRSVERLIQLLSPGAVNSDSEEGSISMPASPAPSLGTTVNRPNIGSLLRVHGISYGVVAGVVLLVLAGWWVVRCTKENR
jgi:lysophospholipase L1-like esterase